VALAVLLTVALALLALGLEVMEGDAPELREDVGVKVGAGVLEPVAVEEGVAPKLRLADAEAVFEAVDAAVPEPVAVEEGDAPRGSPLAGVTRKGVALRVAQEPLGHTVAVGHAVVGKFGAAERLHLCKFHGLSPKAERAGTVFTMPAPIMPASACSS